MNGIRQAMIGKSARETASTVLAVELAVGRLARVKQSLLKSIKTIKNLLRFDSGRHCFGGGGRK